MTRGSELAAQRVPPQPTKDTGEHDDEDGRRAFHCERRHTLAAEEAIAAQCHGQHIDFDTARKRELETFEPTKRSALFLARQRRRASP